MIDWVKKNRLSFITLVLTAVFLIIYIIALIFLLSKRYAKATILSISADYVTVVSCVIIVIQLIAYVKDSRQKEFRSRKEAAYHIACEYANKMLSKVTFIQNVLSLGYDKKNPKALQDTVCNQCLSGFTDADMRQNVKYKKYIELFIDSKLDSVALNDILNQAVINKIPGFLDINGLEDSKTKNYLANVRFRIYLFDTLNILESFAMSVNQNVSDSEMLFSSLHQTYIRFIEFVYPFICSQNIGSEDYYPNIIELYKSWNTKKKSDKSLQENLEQKKRDKMHKKRHSAKPL